jgi:methionine transaminase
MTLHLDSKLPNVGTTIFTTMSAMAQKYGAINLSQGFPDFDCDELLKERICHYFQAGFNQYAAMPGHLKLRQQIALKMQRSYDCPINPETEITVTSGATEALFCAIEAIVQRGDEVIVFDPAYDSYRPALDMVGAKTIHLKLQPPHFKIDWIEVEKQLNHKTKLIIVNSPHNPTGQVMSDEDVEQLVRITNGTNTFILSDEVYEHLVFDSNQHKCLALNPKLKERAISVFSFGKTFHATGWKIGYAVANEMITREFRKIHQFVTFSSATPIQMGLADMIEMKPDYFAGIAPMYQAKREYFLSLLKQTKLLPLTTQGSYFQLASFAHLEQYSQMSDVEFCQHLTQNVGVAAIPISVFYNEVTDHKLVRFCFAKSESTLFNAAKKLLSI